MPSNVSWLLRRLRQRRIEEQKEDEQSADHGGNRKRKVALRLILCTSFPISQPSLREYGFDCDERPAATSLRRDRYPRQSRALLTWPPLQSRLSA